MPLYIPDLILEINNQAAPATLIEDILQISVEESLNLPGMFTLVVKNDYFSGRTQDQVWRHESLFLIGTPIKIGFKNSTTEAKEFATENQDSILEGEITAIETHFTSESQAPVVIRGYDVAHRLHRGRYNRSFQNITDSDIVQQIAGEAGIKTNKIESSGSPHTYVFQENQTNMEFLRERAARLGFEVFVQDGKLNFRKPTAGESLTLQWLKDIHSFQVRISSAEQVSSVQVRGWDYTNKAPIVSTKSSQTAPVITTTEYGKGSSTSSSFRGQPSKPTMIVVDQPVSSTTEADNIAQAVFNELGGEFVQADARGNGDSKIRPGKVVKLSNLGKYSGSYYITETRHLYRDRVYTTEFSVRGLRGGDLITTLSPPKRRQPGETLMVGIVTNNNDRDGLGRVRVKFPTLTEEHESFWARVVGTGAGSGRGFDCLPEVNDEVLVAFEHGDIHRPYVIGGVWNGKDAPPEKIADSVVSGKVRLRTFKTRTGHKIQFVEEDKGSVKAGFYINTKNGHHVRMNDSDKFVEVKTNGGHTLRLDDSDKTIGMTSTGDINVKTGTTGMSKTININASEINLTGTQTINLKVGGSKITITNSGIMIETPGTISISGTSTTVSGNASATLKGATTIINGTATLTMSGAATTVSGSATVGISGALVRINC